MKASYMVFVAVLATSVLVAQAQHDHAEDNTTSEEATHGGHDGHGASPNEAGLASPPAMTAEHAHLHEQLAAAVAAGGKTAEAAEVVEAVLSHHFIEEDAYALPPLGLLEELGQGNMPSSEQAAAAIAMAEKLRANYAKMLDEHRELTESLKVLEAAANAENQPDAAEFARALTLHAQNEEQVLYPATLLIGEYLKLHQADQNGADKHAH